MSCVIAFGRDGVYKYKCVITALIDMVARCETVGKYVLPVFRSLVAKELISAYKLTQVEAAQKLGTTQAAISQYVNSKRALKGAAELSSVMPKLQEMARETAKKVADGKMGEGEISLDFCKLCACFSEEEGRKISEDFSI
jgi:uncharacterized protein